MEIEDREAIIMRLKEKKKMKKFVIEGLKKEVGTYRTFDFMKEE